VTRKTGVMMLKIQLWTQELYTFQNIFLNCNISQYYCFYCIFSDQMYAALVSRRDFQKHYNSNDRERWIHGNSTGKTWNKTPQIVFLMNNQTNTHCESKRVFFNKKQNQNAVIKSWHWESFSLSIFPFESQTSLKLAVSRIPRIKKKFKYNKKSI